MRHHCKHPPYKQISRLEARKARKRRVLYRPMQLLTQAQWWSCLAMHLHRQNVCSGQACTSVVALCSLHLDILHQQSDGQSNCRPCSAFSMRLLKGACLAEPRLWAGRGSAGRQSQETNHTLVADGPTVHGSWPHVLRCLTACFKAAQAAVLGFRPCSLFYGF